MTMSTTTARRSLLFAPALAVGLGIASTSMPADDAESPRTGPFTGASRPVLVAPGLVSTHDGEYSPTYDVERAELIYMRRTPGRYDYTLYSTRWTGSAWSQPSVLPFSGQNRDDGSYFSPDGNVLVFDSNRPAQGLARGSINIWRTQRTVDGWSEPELVRAASENPPPPNGVGADEFGPLLDAQGNLYFYSFRPPYRGGHHYVVRADEPTQARLETKLPDPSAATFISYATLSADGNTAVLEGRALGRNDTDLFLSLRDTSGAWSEPRPIEAVNTTANEGTPYLTSDGAYLLFGSKRPHQGSTSSESDVYVIEMTSVLAGR